MNVYQPYPGRGVQWGLALLLLILGIMIMPLRIMIKSSPNPWTHLPFGILIIALSLVFLYFVYAAASLKYILDDGTLIIKWAFSEKKVDLNTITDVEKRIGISAFKVAAFSWPGLHLGAFSLGDNDNVNLYATRLMGDVILFKHKWETIGITPADPDVFLEDLESRVAGLAAKTIDPQEEEIVRKEAIKKNAKGFHILTVINLILIGATFLWVTLKIPALPGKIPMHIGPQGIDRYGSPTELYLMPTISLVTFILMYVIAFFYRSNRMAGYMLLGASIFSTIMINLLIVSLLAL